MKKLGVDKSGVKSTNQRVKHRLSTGLNNFPALDCGVCVGFSGCFMCIPDVHGNTKAT